MPSAAPFRRKAAAAGKRAFAKRAHGFVKWAGALPGFPHLEIVCAVLAVLMTITGGFRTAELPLGPRALFWALLFGWSAIKWQAWFALVVRTPRDWPRAGWAGGLLLNLLLPVEIALALAAIGVRGTPAPGETWLSAMALSAVAAGAIAALKYWALLRGAPEKRPESSDSRLLARAGVAPDQLIAIEAEDHYCRVRRTGGASALIHYRFGDALGEIASLDGSQVHRGAWVAARAIVGAAREGRRWRLVLIDGSSLPVSATHLAAVRQRGWLTRPSTASAAPSATILAISAPTL